MSRSPAVPLKDFYVSRETTYTPTNRIQTGPSTFPPRTPVQGSVYYGEDTEKLYVYTGMSWLAVEGGDKSPVTGIRSSVPPLNPFPGQIWIHSDTREMKVYDSSGVWVSVLENSVVQGTVPPIAPFQGQIWIDSSNQEIKLYDDVGTWNIIRKQVIQINDIQDLSSRLSYIDASGYYTGPLEVSQVVGLEERLSKLDASGNYMGTVTANQVQGNVLSKIDASGNYTGSVSSSRVTGQVLWLNITSETSDVSVANNVYSFRAFQDLTFDPLPRAYLTTPGTGLTTMRLLVNDTPVFQTNLSIDSGETSSVTAATPASFIPSPVTYKENDLVTVDIVTAGTGARGLKACVFYRTPDPASFLDDCIALYGLRRINPSYKGPTVQIMRSSDGTSCDVVLASLGQVESFTYQNVVYTPGEWGSWTSGSTLNVIKIYDQSGFSNHLDQSKGGGPTTTSALTFMSFDGTKGLFRSPSPLIADGYFSIAAVFKTNSAGTNFQVVTESSSTLPVITNSRANIAVSYGGLQYIGQANTAAPTGPNIGGNICKTVYQVNTNRLTIHSVIGASSATTYSTLTYSPFPRTDVLTIGFNPESSGSQFWRGNIYEVAWFQRRIPTTQVDVLRASWASVPFV